MSAPRRTSSAVDGLAGWLADWLTDCLSVVRQEEEATRASSLELRQVRIRTVRTSFSAAWYLPDLVPGALSRGPGGAGTGGTRDTGHGRCAKLGARVNPEQKPLPVHGLDGILEWLPHSLTDRDPPGCYHIPTQRTVAVRRSTRSSPYRPQQRQARKACCFVWTSLHNLWERHLECRLSRYVRIRTQYLPRCLLSRHLGMEECGIFWA